MSAARVGDTAPRMAARTTSAIRAGLPHLGIDLLEVAPVDEHLARRQPGGGGGDIVLGLDQHAQVDVVVVGDDVAVADQPEQAAA